MGLGLDSALSRRDTRMRWWKDPIQDPVHHSDGEENPGWSSMGSLCAISSSLHNIAMIPLNHGGAGKNSQRKEWSVGAGILAQAAQCLSHKPHRKGQML